MKRNRIAKLFNYLKSKEGIKLLFEIEMKRYLERLRQLLLKIAGYKPTLFWNIYAIDFDKYEQQTTLHDYTIKAIELILEENPENILEIGCGFGRNLKELIKRGFPAEHITGIDISKMMIKKCKKNLNNNKVNLLTGDIIKTLPFDNDSFHTVYCSAVLTHVPPDKIVNSINEVVRIAKKNIIILDTYRQGENDFYSKPAEHPTCSKYIFVHNYKKYIPDLNLKMQYFIEMGEICIFKIDKTDQHI